MSFEVTAVLVAYNCRACIGDALQALEPSVKAGWLQCIVVDNASSDDTVAFVREAHPWARVIEAGGNLGFGRACNVGSAQADAPYVLFLNPDAVLAPAALRRLVQFVDDHPHCGIAAPSIVEPDGSLQQAGGMPTPRSIVLDAVGYRQAYPDRRPIQPNGAPFRTTWVCGAIMLCRTRMLQQIGGFDPRYFLYFEETDLCRRADLAGWEIWAVGSAVGKHTNAVSARTHNRRMYRGCIAEHYFRSRFHYLRLHHGWPRAVATELLELGIMGAKAVPRLLRNGSLGEYSARLRAPILGHNHRGCP